MNFTHGETVTRQRGMAVTDPYSGTASGIDWTTPNELTIDGCGFNPGDSSEPVQTARGAVVTTPEVYAPADADVLPGDRLVVRGYTFEVDGRPKRWISPFTGWAPGLVIALKEVDG